MNIKVIGMGAAGNKAGINLIEKGVLNENKVLLLNTTLKDIPADYRNNAVEFSDNAKGCGKERDLAAEICLSALRTGKLSVLDSFVDPGDDAVIIVTSSEGGSGSGAARIVAKYMDEVIGINVHLFVFTGFEEDGRGLQNTIEYFQDVKENYMVQSISNKKFLDGPNKLKAEKAANDDFVKRVEVLIARGIIDSDQNIDDTDLYKVTNTPGYMTIGKTYIEGKIKNVEQFNKIVSNMIDDDKSLDTEKSVKRLAVFLNVSESTRDNIDFSFSALKEKLGVPYEVFTHVQYDEEQEYISYIASGMQMPLEEVKAVYEKYKEESQKVNKKKDTFFDTASGLRGNDEDSMFNINRPGRRPTGNRDSFFGSFSTSNEDKSDSVENNIIDNNTNKDNLNKF
jgi:cell division GTPase FtsZ